MSNQSWHQLLEQMTLSGTPVPVTGKHLDDFEVANDIKLPKAYRGYCQVFGPGRLNGVVSLKISVPGNPAWNSDLDLLTLNRNCHRLDHAEIDEYCSDPPVWKNALFFGDDCGHLYFWNKSEMSSDDSDCIPVYLAERDLTIHRVASSFASFVCEICLDRGILNWGKREGPFEFWPGTNVA